jgi:hypothetical protein
MQVPARLTACLGGVALAALLLGCGLVDEHHDTPDPMTVGEAIARRDGGQLGSSPFLLTGFWSNRSFGHTCPLSAREPGDLEIWCHDGEFGITEGAEPILTLTPDFDVIPATGPYLTPWMPDAIVEQLVLQPVGDFSLPPTPIVVVGHFDDPRAADCRLEARQLCRDRLVIDSILSFQPPVAPARNPAAPPTPASRPAASAPSASLD